MLAATFSLGKSVLHDLLMILANSDAEQYRPSQRLNRADRLGELKDDC